jgi:hypothetical protein
LQLGEDSFEFLEDALTTEGQLDGGVGNQLQLILADYIGESRLLDDLRGGRSTLPMRLRSVVIWARLRSSRRTWKGRVRVGVMKRAK